MVTNFQNNEHGRCKLVEGSWGMFSQKMFSILTRKVTLSGFLSHLKNMANFCKTVEICMDSHLNVYQPELD